MHDILKDLLGIFIVLLISISIFLFRKELKTILINLSKLKIKVKNFELSLDRDTQSLIKQIESLRKNIVDLEKRYRIWQITEKKHQNIFYRDFLESVAYATDLRILNMSTNAIYRGKPFNGVEFNDDKLLPFRGAYFEFEEMGLTGNSTNFINFINSNTSLSKDDKKRLADLAKRFKPNSDERLLIRRTLVFVAEDTYQEVRSKDEAAWINLTKILQARHISIFEHLERLQESDKYQVKAIVLPIFAPQPTVVYINCLKDEHDSAFWGFILPVGEMPSNEKSDIAVQYKHGDICSSIDRLITRTEEALLETSTIKELNTRSCRWRDLVNINKLLVRDIRDDLANRDVVSGQTLEIIDSELN